MQTRSWLAAAPVALLLLASTWSPAAAVAQDIAEPAVELPAPVTVVLVRHAEKADDDPRDPSLSEVGRARAGRLAALLGHAGVTHLYCTEFRRTRDTLAPLAEAVELEPEVVEARELGRLVRALDALPPGSVAVVAGHSNTVPRVARELGVEVADLVDSAYGPVFDESTYDRVLVVTCAVPERTRSRLVELRY